MIVTSFRRTVLTREPGRAIGGRQVQLTVVERVKSKEGTKRTKICAQETAMPVEPVHRRRIGQKPILKNQIVEMLSRLRLRSA